MRLKYQLFLIMLIASALLIALMAGFGRWSFDRGFLEYIGKIERQRLAPLAESLAAGYAEHGDWSWITTTDKQAWRTLMVEHVVQRRGDRSTDGRRERGASPQFAGPDPLAREDDPVAGVGPSPERRGDGARGAPPTDTGLLTLDPRLLLADVDRRLLIGRDDSEQRVSWQPIGLDNEVVGYLGHRSADSPPDSIDQVFASQQRRGFVYAALAMVLLSALLAISVAARLVRPLLGVTDAVERIGRGEYAHRVPAGRNDEIGNLARDINRLAATLDTSLKARRRWLAEISHELRTPVAILRGELEAIQDGVQPLDQAAIASLHAESLRLNRLIDDLHALTLSDAGALDYRFEMLDLRDILSERLEAGRAGAAERRIEIEMLQGTSSLTVRGDHQRLGQLVDNLLQNSLRYTDPGGTIRLTSKRVGNRAIIEWSDSAPGVDTAHLPRLFEPLYRVDASRCRDSGGAGLGLAIAARIVEAHHGTVSAHPSTLGGLTIRIELPAGDGVAP